MTLKDELQNRLRKALLVLAPDATVAPTLERPKQAIHGDYATSAALQLAKILKMNPRDVAKQLVSSLADAPGVSGVEIAGAGFINIHLSLSAKQHVVHAILKARGDYGRGASGSRQKVMVEFVSANPTGPLHVGHGRGAVIGDVIARLLEWQDWDVHREFYYNDAGMQIANLARSIQARIRQLSGEEIAFPENGYHGDYVRDIARAYLEAYPHADAASNLDAITRFGIESLRRDQDADLEALGVRFDSYYFESSLHTSGRVDSIVNRFKQDGSAFERDGALWLKTTAFGDDKDRVMRKSDGSYTYFVPDIAYHVTKWERGFKRVINEQGADHHSTVTRVRAGLQALDLGIPPSYPEYVLHQMVTVLRGGEEVRISKRAGDYVTVRELIDEVGRDAVRFFFLLRKHDSHLTFDIDLASTRTEENPVYYVQYANARICRVFEEAGTTVEAVGDSDLSALTGDHELALLRKLADFPEHLHNAAVELAPHLLPFYLKDLAAAFHSYYNAERFLVDDIRVRKARLALVGATQQVLTNGLAILGVSAPNKM